MSTEKDQDKKPSVQNKVSNLGGRKFILLQEAIILFILFTLTALKYKQIMELSNVLMAIIGLIGIFCGANTLTKKFTK